MDHFLEFVQHVLLLRQKLIHQHSFLEFFSQHVGVNQKVKKPKNIEYE